VNPAARIRAIVSIAEEIDELFDRFFESDDLPPVWSPPVDLYLSDRKVHLRVELPGVSLRDVEVRIGPRSLLVRGEKPVPVKVRGGVSFYEAEIPYGPFEKRVVLPAVVKPEAHEVEMKDGVLSIEIERAGSVPRVVKIE
jgi:HSP20 family protein